MAKNLFVGSLPYEMEESALEELFSTIGKVDSAKIIKDKYTGRSRGFGFVEMSTEQEAQKAINKLNGHKVNGRNIVVKEALPKPNYGGRSGGFDRNQRGKKY